MRSSGSLSVRRRIISLCDGSPGTIANLPDLVLPSASSRNNTLKPPCFFTPPWQVIHFLFRMGFTSALKSMEWLLLLKVKTASNKTSMAVTSQPLLRRLKLVYSKKQTGSWRKFFAGEKIYPVILFNCSYPGKV